MDAARVRCDGCDFAWYGADSAHGLSVIGRCPRCGAGLRFLESVEPTQKVASGEPAGREPASREPAGTDQAGKGPGGSRFNRPEPERVEPSRVLGVPLTWG
jgi:hypothetical protein